MNHPQAPFPDLIDESLHEAVFLWTRWEADLSSYSRNLHAVWTWSEDRLAGAIDGVQVAPAAMLKAMLSADDGERATARVWGRVLASSPDPAARALLADQLRTAPDAQLQGLARGIEVADLDGSFAPVAQLLAGLGPEHAAVLARLKQFRRAPLGTELQKAYESGIEALQALVLATVHGLPEPYVPAWIDVGLKHAAPAVRLAAITSGLKHRVVTAWGAALELLRAPTAESAGLFRYVAMLGGPAEQRLLFAPHADVAVQRQALWALGHVGTAEAVEHCLEAMAQPQLARAAGEAYCLITGAQLADDRLTAAEPPDAATPEFEADDLEADLVPKPEDLWPLPDPHAVRAHWRANAARFAPGVRHLRGVPADPARLLSALESGPMLRRADHAFELFVRTGGRCDVEVRATTVTQRRMLAAARAGGAANAGVD